jgi:hypothetical protein
MNKCPQRLTTPGQPEMLGFILIFNNSRNSQSYQTPGRFQSHSSKINTEHLNTSMNATSTNACRRIKTTSWLHLHQVFVELNFTNEYIHIENTGKKNRQRQLLSVSKLQVSENFSNFQKFKFSSSSNFKNFEENINNRILKLHNSFKMKRYFHLSICHRQN